VPHLVQVQKKYDKLGFVLIGQHRQGADLKTKVMSLARSQKINYTITQGGNVPGDTSSGIPHAFLFDWTGKCVAEGHPNELYKKVDELMAKAPPWITGGKTLEDGEVAKIAAGLRAPRGYGEALETLEGLSKAEGKRGLEATYLADRLRNYGQRLLANAQEAESEDALNALSGYSELAGLYKGHELGDKAKARLKELKKDKEFKKELKAAKMLAAIENLTGQFKAYGGKVNLQHPANRKPAAQIMKILQLLQKKYGDTKAAARAREAVAPYGIGG